MSDTGDIARGVWRSMSVVTMVSTLVASGQGQERPTAPAARTEVAETLHTARAVVRAGQSAGMVLKLEAEGREGGAALFDLDEAAGRVPPLPTLRGTAVDMLKRHTERSSRFTAAGAVLVDGKASSCSGFLRREVNVDQAGTMLESVVAIFNAGSGQHVPVGVVGSCGLEVARHTPDRVRLEGTFSVGEAFERAIGQVSGIVWLAVEGADGSCSVGLYGRDGHREPPGGPPLMAGDGTFCMVQIGKVP